MSALTKMVLDKARSISIEEAADFFGVDDTSIHQWLLGVIPVPLAAVEKVFDVTKLAPKVGTVARDNQKVCIVFPCYKATNPGTTFSLLSLIDRTRMSVMLQFGDAFIVHTRNQLAGSFLKSKAEWMFTVDDDMILPCGNAQWFNSYTRLNLPEPYASFNSVDRLLSHGKTLVGGLYYGRWPGARPVYGEGQDPAEEKYARRGPHNVCKPTRWVGTGALLVHRSVFLAIEDKFPQLARNKDGDHGNWFTSSEHELRLATQEALNVLNDEAFSEAARIDKARRLMEDAKLRTQRNSTLSQGEDVTFCIRATQAGHQPFVDMGLVCGHQGSFVFGSNKTGWNK